MKCSRHVFAFDAYLNSAQAKCQEAKYLFKDFFHWQVPIFPVLSSKKNSQKINLPLYLCIYFFACEMCKPRVLRYTCELNLPSETKRVIIIFYAYCTSQRWARVGCCFLLGNTVYFKLHPGMDSFSATMGR